MEPDIWNLEDIMHGKAEKEPYPWTPDEDEAFRKGAFKRSWENTSRREWNANPVHSDGVMCNTCGYKWHPSHMMNEAPGTCFNCWVIDNK